MIPVQLTLKNFLSYRETTLDFSGLHIACICGANGAGKSSLLEAMTWAVWGQSRAAAEDDIIHSGAKEVRVDFHFYSDRHKYRVIRTRYRGQSSSLEFQVETPHGFRSLTEKGVRATQLLIIEHIKLDYETFINSAYLRQGRADEFMLKRPNERKEILAELLKLQRYDVLEERAKDLSKSFRAQADRLEQTLHSLVTELQQQAAIAQQLAEIETQVNQLQQEQAFDDIQLKSLQVVRSQQQNWEQQLSFLKQQSQNLTADRDRLWQEHSAINSQVAALAEILAREGEIEAGYQHYQNLLAQEEEFSAKFQEYTHAQQYKTQLEQQLVQQVNELQLQLQRAEGQLVILQQQEQETQQALSKSAEVEAGVVQLAAARDRLANLDRLQLQVTPLIQRRNTLQSQIDKAEARLTAKLEELKTQHTILSQQQLAQSQLQQTATEVAVQIEQLEKDKVYIERVREKGQERRHFLERLQEQQREYEKQLGEVEQKIQMLSVPDAVCPLCERPLDEHHWNRVVDKTKEQKKDTEEQFIVIREQLVVTETEIQELRRRYREVAQKLSQYDALREQRGQVIAQLSASEELQSRLEQIEVEQQHLERSLARGDYAADLQAELSQIDCQIEQLNYSEETHALARSEVDKLRWAEVRQAQIKDAQKRQAQISARQPEMKAQIDDLCRQIEQYQVESECAQQIAAIACRIDEIGYDPDRHNALRTSIRQAQAWQLSYQHLLSAQEQYPQLQQRSRDLTEAIQARTAEGLVIATQIEEVTHKLAQSANPTTEIQTLEAQLALRRRQLDDRLSQLGRLQQQSQYLAAMQAQYEQQQQQLQVARRQQRVYQELGQAFGKNGIQALMIENLLPQLEAETNQLLARLSANQLHVQFITQKAGRSGRSVKKNAKMIDTLDILIADARGTRPYETYSGGEAFRINFAIRLALARLLAQRAGASLQLLIVDEGFGTQDQEGCDRLIAAVNAIAADFSCILAVTHMPYFKEAFQARIEVVKTQNGSQLSLSM
jgi:exonuclease SbcC